MSPLRTENQIIRKKNVGFFGNCLIVILVIKVTACVNETPCVNWLNAALQDGQHRTDKQTKQPTKASLNFNLVYLSLITMKRFETLWTHRHPKHRVSRWKSTLLRKAEWENRMVEDLLCSIHLHKIRKTYNGMLFTDSSAAKCKNPHYLILITSLQNDLIWFNLM